MIGSQRNFQFSQDLGGLLYPPSEFLRTENKIRGEVKFHHTLINQHVVGSKIRNESFFPKERSEKTQIWIFGSESEEGGC